MNKKLFIVIINLIILISCFFLLYPYIFFISEEGFSESDRENILNNKEEIKKNVIPLDIYETWHTKNLPPKMKECVDKIKYNNPEFTYNLYDENDCREFIKNNFENDVLEAFDGLIPLSYKSDLWRFCILYKKGGIYLDIKYEPVNDFKFIDLVDKEYFICERPYMDEKISLDNELTLLNQPDYYEKIYDKIDSNLWNNKNIGLYTALIICKPNNPVLLNCINKIVKNVKNKEYGYNSLYTTGPGLFGEQYFKGDMSKIKNLEIFYSINGKNIITKKKYILKHYSEYRDEQKKYGKSHNYHELWKERKIYKE